ATVENFVRQAQQAHGMKGGFHDVGVVAGTEGFGQDILHADRLAYRAHAATRDDARSRRSGLEQDVTAAVNADDFVGDGVVDQVDLDEVAARGVAALL